MTRNEKATIREYILDYYSNKSPEGVRIAADGAVTVQVDPMPNTNQAGRIFAGWDTELIRTAQDEGFTPLGKTN